MCGDRRETLPKGSYTVYMMRLSVPALFITLLLPLVLFAQDDTLRTTIRADIMSDPRSSQMSPTEIDTLVEALAQQAEAQGVDDDYLEAQSSFDGAYEAPVYQEEAVPYNLLSLALLSLFIVLAGVIVFLAWQRRKRSTSISL